MICSNCKSIEPNRCCAVCLEEKEKIVTHCRCGNVATKRKIVGYVQETPNKHVSMCNRYEIVCDECYN